MVDIIVEEKMILSHIFIIVSSEEGINFYKTLGFEEFNRLNRGYDQVVCMEGNCCTLKLFVDSSHPQRTLNLEPCGLRYLSFETEHLEQVREKLIKYNPEKIRNDVRLFLVKDPDGQTIEIREYLPKSAKGNCNFED